jgi:hypothetical protein
VKSNYLVSAAFATLLFGCAIANAQNSPSTSSSAQSGNNLDTTSKPPNVDPASAPPTTGQDKTHGNDMVSPNGTAKDGGMKQADASRPDFDTLDKKGKGTLAAADVKGNPWLRKNFSKCDTDHDGTLSREEYMACK